MESTSSIQFGVRKGAKFLFECAIQHQDVLPSELRQYAVRVDEMHLLANTDIAITKRLNIVEVDRMISCCRQHPPQALVAPVHNKDSAEQRAFEDLAIYLRQRERAGVASINPGTLVMFIPIEDRNDYLRCQIVNAATTVGEIGAQMSTVIAPGADPVTAAPPTSPSSSAKGSQQSPVARTETTDIDHSSTPAEPEVTATQLEGDTHGSTTDKDDQDSFTQLRHEHAAFNAFYHHVLLEWSTKPSDIDSAP